VWIVVLFFYPVIGNTVDLNSIVSGIIFTTGAWSLGILILYRVECINELRGIAKDGIAILLGAIVFFWLLFALPLLFNNAVFYGLTILFLLSVVMLKRVQPLSFDLGSLLAISLGLFYFTVLSIDKELTYALGSEPIQVASDIWDAFYYTSIVASMKTGALTAIFEVGTPLNYQLGSFFAPASFSGLTQISSHISLWGCWMPFYKILGLLLIAEFVLIIAQVRYAVWQKAIVVFLFIFLIPLHPEYILKLEYEKFILKGMGYLIPETSPPTAMSFAWISLIGIAVLSGKTMKYNLYTSIFIILLLSALILVKVPMFIPFAVFIGIISLALAAKKNYQLFLICCFSFFLSVVIYKFNYGDEGQSVVSFKIGYLPLLFAKYAGFTNILAGYAVLFVMLLFYGGLRYLGLYFLWKNHSVNLNVTIVTALLLSILAAVLIASSFNIVYLNPAGEFYDGTMDLDQFVRASFGLMGIIPAAGFILIFYGNSSKRLKQISIGLCICWSGLAFVGMTNEERDDVKPVNTSWYDEVKEEMRTHKPKLSAIHSSSKYSGQQLAADDLGVFWVSTIGKEGGYNLSNKNYWRGKVMDLCLSSDSSIQIQAYQTLIENNVDAIIASPETIKELKLFAKYNKLKQPAGLQWIYPLQQADR